MILRLLGLLMVFPCLAALDAAAYQLPEVLEYEVSLRGVNIGHVSVDARQTDQQILYRVKASATKWVSAIYEVEDFVESIEGKPPAGRTRKMESGRVPLKFTKIFKEGEHRVNEEVLFDYEKKWITTVDRLAGTRTIHTVKSMPLDLLSSLYYLRRSALTVGKSVYLPVYDNKALYTIELQVLRRETVKTKMGTFNALVVSPRMNISGLGLVYLPGDLHIWLTDDDRKVPVLIEKRIVVPPRSRVPESLKPMIEAAVGKVRAELTKRN
jgi:hypothetical protein